MRADAFVWCTNTSLIRYCVPVYDVFCELAKREGSIIVTVTRLENIITVGLRWILAKEIV